MDAPVSLARELTTQERMEYLLTVIACGLTGQQPAQLCPWHRSGLESFLGAVRRG